MAKNTIAQFEHLFQDFDLQMTELNKLNVKQFVALNDACATWQRLVALFQCRQFQHED